MQGLRPPSYRTIGSPGSPTTTLSSTSSLWPIDDHFYDPPAEIFARDLKSQEIRSNSHPRSRPIRSQTAPEELGQGSTTPSLSIAPSKPFPAEKSRPAVIRPRPSAGQIYAFSMGSNSMTLTPTVDVKDNQPQYYVTIQMNYFMPLSFITSVHRFPNEKVGEFEMGITTVPGTVQIGTHKERISNILSKSGSRNSCSWFWSPLVAGSKYCLRWDYDKRPCVCRSTGFGEKPVLALFTSPFGLESSSGVAMLEVTPAGQELFDHILMSLLIIERRRLTPDQDKGLKPLFSQ